MTYSIQKSNIILVNSFSLRSPTGQEQIVKGAKGIELLKELKAKEKLLFDNEILFANFFAPVEFYYEGDELFQGYLRLENKVITLSECSLFVLGPPHFFIYNKNLRIVKGDILPRWIELAFKGPFKLDEKKIETLVEAGPEDSFPKLYLLGKKSEQVSLNAQPLPVLKLTDRHGAFANLWMKYGDKEERAYDTYMGSKEEALWEKDLLETSFVYKPLNGSSYYCPVDKVAKSLTFLLECGWNIFDARGMQVVRKSGEDIEYVLDNKALKIKGNLSFDKYKASLQDVVGAFNRRESFVQLSDGKVGLLDSQDENVAPLLEGEIVQEGIKLKRTNIGLLKENTLLRPQTCLKDIQEGRALVEYHPSENFKAELRPYQRVGFSWLCFLQEYGFNGLLADDMGLGKTVQLLAFLSRCEKGPHLIVMPTSLIFNWKKEIERFLPGMGVYLHTGTEREKSLEALEEKECLLTTYATLRIDIDLLSKVNFKTVILDEAQVIKNPDTQVAKAVCSLNAEFKVSMTGTPVENHLEDLWSQYHFLMPELLGGRKEFEMLLQACRADARHIKILRKRIQPFILRRSKKEVAKDLPEKIEQEMYVQMLPAQREYYESFLAGVKHNLLKKVTLDGMKAHKMEVFEAILRLRQICCHPLLLGEDAVSGKWEAFMEDLETILEEGRKVLVYSQFTSMLKLIHREISLKHSNVLYLDGSTKDRESIVQQFQEDPKCNLFLISLKAGGVGLNLTSADYVLLYDPWWNESVENQAIDRAHRIGRKDVVIAKRYITAESIEEKMMTLKSAKRALVKNLLDEEWVSTEMTEEDLEFLLT